MKILILKIGEVEDEVLRAICKGVEKTLPNTKCVIKVSVAPLPPEAFNRERGQYEASYILSWITLHRKEYAADRILGVTEADLYAKDLNFIFGQAQFSGKTCLISTHRLRPEFYGLRNNRELFTIRCIKEAVHELGHTFGLYHCRNPLCVMYFSNSIYDTDLKRAEFCERCKETITNILQ